MYIFQFWLFPSNPDFFPQNCEFKSQNSDFFSQLWVYLLQFWLFASQLQVYISQFFLFLFSQLRVYISQFWLGNLQFLSFLCYCKFTSRNYYYQQGTHEQLSQRKKKQSWIFQESTKIIKIRWYVNLWCEGDLAATSVTPLIASVDSGA